MKKIVLMAMVCLSLFSSSYGLDGRMGEVIILNNSTLKLKGEQQGCVITVYFQVYVDSTAWGETLPCIYLKFLDKDEFVLERRELGTVKSNCKAVYKGDFKLNEKTWKNTNAVEVGLTSP